MPNDFIKKTRTFNYEPAMVVSIIILITLYLVMLISRERLHWFAEMCVLASCPVFGILSTWFAMKNWRLDECKFFNKIQLDPVTAAMGIGAPLAGLPVALMEVLITHSTIDNWDDVCSVFFILITCGQTFWMVWPLAGLQVIWRDRPSLLEAIAIIQAINAIFGIVCLIPMINYIVVFYTFALIGDLFGLF